jgi:hypothetical protein
MIRGCKTGFACQVYRIPAVEIDVFEVRVTTLRGQCGPRVPHFAVNPGDAGSAAQSDPVTCD